MYVTVESSKRTFEFFQLCFLFSCSNSNTNIKGKGSLPWVQVLIVCKQQKQGLVNNPFSDMVSYLTSSFQHFKEFMKFILDGCIVTIVHVVHSSFHTVVGSSAVHIKRLLEI